jgi:hypothetical protein
VAFSASTNIDPGEDFAWGLAFDGVGGVIGWDEWRYSGVDAAGISIETTDGPVEELCARAFTGPFAQTATRRIPGLVMISCLKTATSTQQRTIRAPLPPTTIMLSIGGKRLRLALDVGKDNQLLTSVTPQ